MTTYWAEDLALMAKAMGEPSRARMLIALMDARAWTASELACCAGISKGTATTHLNHLVDVGLLDEVRQGRHRYVRLRNQDVADAIEALVRLNPSSGLEFPSTYRARTHAHELQHARTCYKHLAGALGVKLSAMWQTQGFITSGWEVTGAGLAWAEGIGLRMPQKPARALVRPCLDWTERMDHAAGVLPDLFTQHALACGWFKRGTHPRSITVTPLGAGQLEGLGLPLALGAAVGAAL
jgi:DNA-binding transcriptional ArsR family regulator